MSAQKKELELYPFGRIITLDFGKNNLFRPAFFVPYTIWAVLVVCWQQDERGRRCASCWKISEFNRFWGVFAAVAEGQWGEGVINHGDQPEPLGQIPSMYDEVNVIACGMREDIKREIIVACAMQQ
jgi:hypothetical protein